MKDRAWFEAQRATLKTRLEQLKADYNAVNGAMQFCEQAITDLLTEDADALKPSEPSPVPSSTATTWPAPVTMTSIGD